ncbi:MAG: hypothetical protein WBH31_03690 [Promethearchaeia archaeon]
MKDMGESTGWKHESLASGMGKWAWIVVLINGIIDVSYYAWVLFVNIAWNATMPSYLHRPLFFPIWSMLWGVVIIIIAVAIIKPKFSNKCAAKDWDALYDWVLNLGKLRMPWMLVWGVIITIFGMWGWAGILILVPAFLLLFAGPKKYNWKKE